MAGTIQVQIDPRGIGWLTIAHETKLNTLNSELMESFVSTLNELEEIPHLRAVVLTGAGSRAFIGGADIDEMAGLSAATARDFITRVHKCCEVIRDLPVPVIARINGWTLGAGLEVAAACDLRIAVEGARFGMPEVKLGIPSVVEAALLPGLVGWGRTREMLLLGETFGAAEALAWGLVERVVAEAELEGAIETWLTALLSAEPEAVALQKALIRKWEDLPMKAAISAGIDAFEAAWTTEAPAREMARFQRERAERRKV